MLELMRAELREESARRLAQRQGNQLEQEG